MKPTTCRYCGRSTLSLCHPGLATFEDNGYRLYELHAVPADTCAVQAYVLTRAGIRWANEVPTASHVFPMHRCPQYVDELVAREYAAMTPRRDVEAFMDRRPLTPGPAPSRVRRTA